MVKKGFFKFLYLFSLFIIAITINNITYNKTFAKVSKKKTSEQLIQFPVPYIPVLSDFNYVSDESAILKTSQTLTGILVYKTKYKIKDIVNFYKTQMISQGWKEIGIFISKTNFLAYKRPEGTAFISIKSESFNTEIRIVIILTFPQTQETQTELLENTQ